MPEVIIEKWKVDGSSAHCHEPGFDGIHAYGGSVATATVEDFVDVGLISRRLRGCLSEGYFVDPQGCDELCQLVDRVLAYTDSDIKTARENLDDLVLEEPLSDHEVAYLDFQAREILAEEARCVVNPWLFKSYAVERLLDDHLAKKEAKHVDA